MADTQLPGSGGGGGGGTADSTNDGTSASTNSGPIWSSLTPKWVDDLSKYADWLIGFAKHPFKTLRGLLVGWFLALLGSIVRPIFDAMTFLVLGSQPGTFGAPGETIGVADIPVAIARPVGNALGAPFQALFGAFASLVTTAVPATPGPTDGIVFTAVGIALVVAVVRYGPVVLRALLEAIPVVGGPLATLLGGLNK